MKIIGRLFSTVVLYWGAILFLLATSLLLIGESSIHLGINFIWPGSFIVVLWSTAQVLKFWKRCILTFLYVVFGILISDWIGQAKLTIDCYSAVLISLVLLAIGGGLMVWLKSD